MANLIKQAMRLIIGDDPRKMLKRPLKPLTDRQLIKLESEIGRTLFGEVPVGRTREFFCLDAETWVWYEQWLDENGKEKNHTIRYEIHPKGVLKVQDGGANYSFLSGQELENLSLATQTYKERVARELYKQDPKTGNLMMKVPGIINRT